MDTYKRTLIILSPGFPAHEDDTTCLPAQQAFVRALRKSDPHLEVIVVAFQYPFFKGSYDWHGVRVVALGGRNRGRLHRLQTWRRAWLSARRILRTRKVTGVISFWYGECALLGKWLAQEASLPHYCWMLGQDARKGNRYVGLAGLKPDALVAMSDFLASEMQRNYGVGPANVVPNGIFLEDHQDEDAPRSIDVLGVGSLIPLKRFEIFVNAIKWLKEQYPGIRAVICGQGPEYAALHKKITAEGLQDNILLTGELPHQEVLKLMRRSKILLHPSSYEGFSTVCLEALACGAEVISFCRAMDHKIEGWHIVASEAELQDKLLERLYGEQYGTVRLPYTMEDTARRFLRLLAQEPVAERKQLV